MALVQCGGESNSLESWNYIGANRSNSLESWNYIGANRSNSLESWNFIGANRSNSLESWNYIGTNRSNSLESWNYIGANLSNSLESWNYIGANRSNPSFVVKFYGCLSFSVYVGLKFRATDKMMPTKRLGRKRLLSNHRTTPEYGGKEINTLY